MGNNNHFCEEGYNPNDLRCHQGGCDVEGCKKYTIAKFGSLPDLKIVDEKPESAENEILQLLLRISNQNEMILEAFNTYIGSIDNKLESIEQLLKE